uniref:Uncharacterized protein n=1 Tax=viral metagenome TaxID=1070528 RepID=A0A6M3LXC6_9ZZZZ
MMSKEAISFTLLATLLGVCLTLIILGVVNAAANILISEGYPVTITGTVQIHVLSYNKVFNYEYTKIELLTFSGGDYELNMLGHVEMEFGRTYRITYTRISPLGHHQDLYAKVLEIELIE